MTDLLETRLNDVPYSATSCSWKFALAPFVGIVAFDYGQKRERKLVHASRKDGTPLGITGGKYSVDTLSVTFLRSSYQRLCELLTPLGLGSYGDARIPILATYSEPLAIGVPPIIIAITGARITAEQDTFAEGIDELVTKVDFMATSMTRNGLRLFSVVNGIGL
jgi:hypothetical protein